MSKASETRALIEQMTPEEKQDWLLDSAYRAGFGAGWNAGLYEDHAAKERACASGGHFAAVRERLGISPPHTSGG